MEYSKVACTACNLELRNNQWLIERHWKNKHKDRLEQGETASTKIPSAGTKTLAKFFPVHKKDDKKVENEKESTVGLKERPEKESDLEEGAELEINVDNCEFEDTGVKRALPDNENNNENPAKRLKGDAIDVILQKLEAIDKKVDDMKQERGAKQVEKVEESAVKSDQVDKKFKESSTIKELEVVLDSFQFLKREDIKEGVDGYFCGLCFDGSEPNWESGQIAGAFKYSKTEEKEELQSRNLRNLKSSAKTHIVESKVHQQKKKLKETKDENYRKTQDRTRIVGLNIFRERYNGIRQSKSRLDFEEDMLKAKMCGEDVGDINHSREFAKRLDVEIYNELKENMKESMVTELDATGKKRPAGLMMDKMTPRRRTGQMHAVVIPVPENPLSQVRYWQHWIQIPILLSVLGFYPPHDA